MKLPIKALAFVIASLFAVSAQAATIVTVDFSGVVASGIDDGGMFGTTGADLTGSAYSLVYSLQIDDLSDETIVFPGVHTARQYSGPSALSSAVLTIGNATQTLLGTGIVSLSRYLIDTPLLAEKNTFSYGIHDLAVGYSIFAGIGTANTVFGGLDPAENFSYDVADADRTSPFTQTILTGPNDSEIRFTARQVSSVSSVTSPAAVPEPATWAMMMIGFGAVGGALRRRGRTATTVRCA